MRTYSIITFDEESKLYLEKYCKENNISLRKHSNGFVDYDWYNAELSSKDVKILSSHNIDLLKKTIFNKKLIDFFIDGKE